MNQMLGNYINGQWSIPRDPQSSWKLASPADSKDLIGEFLSSSQEIDDCIDSAYRAYKKWRKVSPQERFQFLKKYQSALRDSEELLLKTISRETGKPFWESKSEVQTMINKVDITLDESMRLIETREFENILPSTRGILHYKPHGVLVVVGPFNFPGHLPNGHLIPALASGNTVIFKPSEKTPLTGQIIAQCFEKAGFPPGVFNLYQGDKEVSRRLCLHENVAGILFTGSYEVGLRIKQDTLAQHWKVLALEMGGKNTSIIWKDTDLRASVYETLVSAFITCGQRCSATSRVLLHKDIADAFITQLHEASKNFKIGIPSENPFMGPLIDHASVDRFLKFQPIATREGYELIMRGKQLDKMPSSHFVTPTIAVQNTPTLEGTKRSTFNQNEIFAPFLGIQLIQSESEAVELANATQYGLVSSIFTRSKELYHYFYDELEVGLVNWNRGTIGASSKLPFGGLKKSGNHMPTALTSTLYCASPISSLECTEAKLPAQFLPGIKY
jgi:succinylglutamic semialdehyde dehydrogenase